MKKLSYDDLDKTKCYCNKCFLGGIIKELKEDFNNSGFLLPPDCEHFGRGFHKLKFYNNEWRVTIGLKFDQKPKIVPIQHHICPECNYKWNDKRPVNNCTCPKCGWSTYNIDYKNRKYIHHCDKCGYEETNNKPTANWICPKCNDRSNIVKFYHKCPDCEYEEYSIIPTNRWICPKCKSFANLSDVLHHCDECGYEEINKHPDNTWICPKCGKKKTEIWHHICPDCGNEQDTFGTIWTCNKCNFTNFVKGNHEHVCQKCGYEWSDQTPNGLYNCPKCGFQNKITNHHSCGECGYEEDNVIPVNVWKCPKCNWKPDNYLPGWNTIKYMNCKEHGEKSPHRKESLNGDYKCLVCSGNYIWCELCKQWEPLYFHDIEGDFYKKITNNWIKENLEIVKFLEEKIKGFNALLNSSKICGIYGWVINENIIYIGQSTDILSRSYDHMMNIVKYPEFWYNIFNRLDKNILEIRILEEINTKSEKYRNMANKEFKEQVLNPLELKYIEELKPDSQKCDGTDRIKPINERKFKIVT